MAVYASPDREIFQKYAIRSENQPSECEEYGLYLLKRIATFEGSGDIEISPEENRIALQRAGEYS